MITIAIVDDEEVIRSKVQKLIENTIKRDDFVKFEVFCSAEMFLKELCEGKKFDILFTDIQMSDMNGIELAKMIRQENSDLYIIYITSYAEYAAEGYKLNVYQYIVKQDMEVRLPEIARNLIDKIKKDHDQYRIIHNVGGQEKIYLKDIVYIYKGKESKYIYYVTDHGEHKERCTLEQIWKVLEGQEFVKVERAYIVNIRHIIKLEKNKLFLSNQEQLTISKYRIKDVKLDINRYWSEM